MRRLGLGAAGGEAWLGVCGELVEDDEVKAFLRKDVE